MTAALRRPPGAFALFATMLVVLLVDAVALPILLREQATDWRAYEDGARILATGGSLYGWTVDADIRAITDYPYLYPPPLAAIWSIGLSAGLFAALKVASIAAAGAFAWLALPGASRRVVLAAGVAVSGLALASPPVVHDLVLGNVMTLYLAALALVVAMPGRWWAGIPIGIVVAIALKPAVAPVLVWMLLCRRDQFLAALGAGLATTAIFAALLGPSVYFEYLAAIPKLGALAQPFSGNLGLSSISMVLAVVAIPVAFAWVIWAARALDPFASAAVALAVALFAQPTLGLNYGALLIPGIAALWLVKRSAAVGMAISLPIVGLFSPPLAGLVLAMTASVVGLRAGRTADAAPGPAEIG